MKKVFLIAVMMMFASAMHTQIVCGQPKAAQPSARDKVLKVLVQLQSGKRDARTLPPAFFGYVEKYTPDLQEDIARAIAAQKGVPERTQEAAQSRIYGWLSSAQQQLQLGGKKTVAWVRDNKKKALLIAYVAVVVGLDWWQKREKQKQRARAALSGISRNSAAQSAYEQAGLSEGEIAVARNEHDRNVAIAVEQLQSKKPNILEIQRLEREDVRALAEAQELINQRGSGQRSFRFIVDDQPSAERLEQELAALEDQLERNKDVLSPETVQQQEALIQQKWQELIDRQAADAAARLRTFDDASDNESDDGYVTAEEDFEE